MTQSIESVIADLYRIADIPRPTGTQVVILLGELMGGYNLTCTEIAGLTSKAASNFLMWHGAILEPLDDTNEEPLAGYIYVSKTSGHIFVERNDFLVRRRFSVAHELGHYLLHFLPLINSGAFVNEYESVEITEALAPSSPEEDADDLPLGQVRISLQTWRLTPLPPYEQMEREANEFAAELLMPVEVIRELVKHYAAECLGDDLTWRLSSEMLVSRAAVRWRLRELHLLLASTAEWT
jgi:Zn-dependent peptidase ImmA (M78 family)